MDFNLIHSRNDSSNAEDSLCLENVEIRKACCENVRIPNCEAVGPYEPIERVRPMSTSCSIAFQVSVYLLERP